MIDYISTKEAAQKWDLSDRRVQKLCKENRINGALLFSRVWAIPKKCEKPVDARKKANTVKK